MTDVGSVYGESLYQLAKDEQLTQVFRDELKVLQESFRQEPEFIRLISSPNLSKAERCQILDDSFRGKVHGYILNFMKILTEKGYMRHFSNCCDAYVQCYNHDNGILPVTAISAVALSAAQAERLAGTLSRITGKQVELHNRVDTGVLGGIRLDYDGRSLDDTVSHRLDSIRDLLKTDAL